MNISIAIIVLTFIVTISTAQSVSNMSTPPTIAEFDKNRNGKIDAEEHKAYVHEIARQRRAEAKELARHRPRLNPQERLFYSPPKLTPEVLSRYDANHNGKLDLPEKIVLQRETGERAKAEFRSRDKNGDGKLSKEERAGMKTQFQREQALRRARPKSTESTPTTISNKVDPKN